MTLSYNTGNSQVWGSSVTSRSTTVNCSGTYRYAVAWTISTDAYPSGVTYNGVSMTPLLSQNYAGIYFRMYGLEDPDTGSRSCAATWSSSQTNASIGCAVVASDTAQIIVVDTNYTTFTGIVGIAVDTTVTSATGDLVLGSSSVLDLNEYGYGVTNVAGASNSFSQRIFSSTNYFQGSYTAGSSGSTSIGYYSSNSDGDMSWIVMGISLRENSGGGSDVEDDLGGSSITVSRGTASPSTDKAISGSSTTSATGTVSPDKSVALTGQSTSILLGNVVVPGDTTEALAGTQINLSTGTINLQNSKEVSGQEISGSTGTASPSTDKAISGSSTTSATGTVSTDKSVALTGQSVTVSKGSVFLVGTAPEGEVDFDCAVGTDALAIRNVTYSDDDTNSSGFKLQYRVKINVGSYSSWTDITQVNILNNWPFEIGGDWIPNDIVVVQLRAVNDSGNGAESDEKTFRLHESWHRTGVKPAYNTTTGVGYIGAGWDVLPHATYDGPLTTSGNDRAIFVALDTSYAQPNNQIGWVNNVNYNGNPVTKIISHGTIGTVTTGSGSRREGEGGFEAFLESGVPTGSNTLELVWTDPLDQRSLEVVAVALKLVNQSSPLASQRLRLLPNLYKAGNAGVDDVDYVSGEDVYSDQAGTSKASVQDIPVSLDEYVLSVCGFYGTAGQPSGAPLTNSFGQATNSSDWSPGNVSTPRLGTTYPNGPSTTGLHLFAGDGNVGQQVAISIADFDDCAPSFPLHKHNWNNTFSYWSSVYAIAIKPSPNMVNTLTVPLASTDFVNYQCNSEVNHGRILLAVTSQSDTAPTAQQIRDQLDESSSDYSGTFLVLDDKVLASGEVSSAGGTVTGSIEGVPFGNYRLTIAYESWQWNLGTAISQNFAVTDIIAALTGSQITSNTGIATGNLSKATSGQLASISLGSLGKEKTKEINGQSVVLQQTTIVPTASIATSGSDISSSLSGFTTVDSDKVLQYNLLNTSQGTTVSNIDKAISNQLITISLGTLTESIDYDILVGLTGLMLTFSQGTVTRAGDVTANITGLNINISQGSFGVLKEVGLSTNSIIVSINNITAGISVIPQSNSISFSTGSLGKDKIVGLSGSIFNISLGTLLTSAIFPTKLDLTTIVTKSISINVRK